MGPWPMHDVVVIAVRKAVSAATATFTAISTKRFFIRYTSPRLILDQVVIIVATTAVVASVVAA